MGYSIPPPDFTLPPMQINVGAEIGKSFGEALREYGRIKRQERKDAEKLLQTQNAFKNQILINQQEAKTKFFKSVEAAGIYDTDKENELFDQFKVVVNNKAKAALDARMAMEFGKDLSDEDRAAYAKTVADFKTYSSDSMTQMGSLIADIDTMRDMNNIVVGDPVNGEQLVNTISLSNLSGQASTQFGDGAITSRNLIEKDGKNVISSVVKIPANSQYLKNINGQTGDGATALLKAGIEAGNIKEEVIDGKSYMVFKNDINISNYSLKGGMDLVQEKLAPPKPNDVLTENGFLDKKGSWNTQFISKEPIITQEIEKDSFGKNTGYEKKVEFQIVDVNKMQTDPAFGVEMNAEYSRVFENPSTSKAQRQHYLLENKSMLGVDQLAEIPTELSKQKVVNAMAYNMFDGYFKSQYDSEGDQQQNIQMQLGTKNDKGEWVLTDQEKAILKAAQEAGIKNPATPGGAELYKEGDTIYLTRQETTRTYREPSISGGTENQVMFAKIYAALEKGDLSGFNSVQLTPGNETRYKYFEQEGDNAAGVYEVDKDQLKIGNKPEDIEILKSVYAIGTK